jgi:hypothetical protein
VLGVIAFMAMLGLVSANIDQAAHMGGLVVGLVVGLLLIGPWPSTPITPRRLMARRAASTVAIAAGLATAAVVVAQRGDAVISPALRLDDFCDQLAPIICEFNAIRGDTACAIGLDDAKIAAIGLRRRAIEALEGLRTRSRINAGRLAAICPSRPGLHGIHETLVDVLEGQVTQIEALTRYAETGDPQALEAARRALAATLDASQECEIRCNRYLALDGLLPVETPGPSGH